MYKPLSIVLGKTDREFERDPLFKVSSLVSKDESRNNTRRIFTPQDDAVRRNTVSIRQKTRQPAARQSRKETAVPLSRPRCIRSYRSDRVAIYNETHDTFHAYSVTEGISQPGLSFQEAVDWVDERLVLVGNGTGTRNFTVAVSLVLASWAVAILIVSSFVRLVF